MGKKDGFLLYERVDQCWEEPLHRILHWNEFRQPMSMEERKKQAGRCMNCGIPFCQSGMKLNGMYTGCPLHNLIPEWNDMLYLDNVSHALSRLTKINCFPEFTGRVCPALCEAACTCGLNGSSVTVHENELSIIEEAFRNDLIRPEEPEIRTGKNIAIVGSGPSGLTAAYILNRRGHSVTVFERDEKPGGLLMYGIPNMKLDKKIVARRIDLMEKEGVVFRTGVNVGKDITLEELQTSFDAVILCTGSRKPRDLNVAGRDSEGISFAVDFLSRTTKELLSGKEPREANGKHVVIVGGGDTGNDCVGTVIRMGCKDVVQLEMLKAQPTERTADNPWPEWPRVLKTDYGQQEAIAVFGHDPRIFETTVKEIRKDESGHISSIITVRLNGREEIPGSEQELPCDLLLIAAGFLGCEDELFENFGIEKTNRGTILTDEDDYASSKAGIFTAGDAHRGQSLVVWAIYEGKHAARQVDEYLMGYSEL